MRHTASKVDANPEDQTSKRWKLQPAARHGRMNETELDRLLDFQNKSTRRFFFNEKRSKAFILLHRFIIKIHFPNTCISLFLSAQSSILTVNRFFKVVSGCIALEAVCS